MPVDGASEPRKGCRGNRLWNPCPLHRARDDAYSRGLLEASLGGDRARAGLPPEPGRRRPVTAIRRLKWLAIGPRVLNDPSFRGGQSNGQSQNCNCRLLRCRWIHSGGRISLAIQHADRGQRGARSRSEVRCDFWSQCLSFSRSFTSGTSSTTTAPYRMACAPWDDLSFTA